MASVALAEQVAAVAGPFACLTAQHADAAPVASAAVVLTAQHADEGPGSLAGVRLVVQTAVASSTAYVPASMAASSGSGQWLPRYPHTSDDTGIWR